MAEERPDHLTAQDFHVAGGGITNQGIRGLLVANGDLWSVGLLGADVASHPHRLRATIWRRTALPGGRSCGSLECEPGRV